MIATLFLAACLFATPEEDKAMIDLVKEGKAATLCTDFKGIPFGSMTPYAIDKKGRPFVYLSDLAQHTENITKNAKGSIMVTKIDKEDIFNSARITFAGKLVKVSDKERAKLRDIYLKAHPGAETFIDFGDFNFYRIEATHIHYIGGFGDINWVEPNDYFKAFKAKYEKKKDPEKNKVPPETQRTGL